MLTWNGSNVLYDSCTKINLLPKINPKPRVLPFLTHRELTTIEYSMLHDVDPRWCKTAAFSRPDYPQSPSCNCFSHAAVGCHSLSNRTLCDMKQYLLAFSKIDQRTFVFSTTCNISWVTLSNCVMFESFPNAVSRVNVKPVEPQPVFNIRPYPN